jgi:hypothetical protein
MHKALLASLGLNMLELIVWTPNFHASSTSFLSLTLNLLQIMVLLVLALAVYKAHR